MLITVTLMLTVPTPLVASPVPVTWATVEMDSPVWVSGSFLYELKLILSFQILMSVPLMLITVTLMLTVPTPLVALPVPVTWATVEMALAVLVSASSWTVGELTTSDLASRESLTTRFPSPPSLLPLSGECDPWDYLYHVGVDTACWGSGGLLPHHILLHCHWVSWGRWQFNGDSEWVLQ